MYVADSTSVCPCVQHEGGSRVVKLSLEDRSNKKEKMKASKDNTTTTTTNNNNNNNDNNNNDNWFPSPARPSIN